jgi:uncharacterized membrane protein YhaH (DUF805 family)
MFNTKLKDNRMTFLFWNLFSVAIMAATIAIVSFANTGIVDLVIVGGFLFSFAVSLCAAIRRLNDLEWSRWNLVWFIIPVVNYVAFFVFLCSKGSEA